MRTLMLLSASGALALSLSAVPQAAPQGAPQAADCTPSGNVRFICGAMGGPEDFAFVPGTDWILASSYSGGILSAINTRDQKPIKIFPAATPKERLDSKTYGACPGPIVPAEPGKERTHGLYLLPGRNSTHTMYMVHHGNRESVEVFEVDGRANPPALTWIGCVIAPEKTTLNSVVALPEGGFAVTNTQTVGGTGVAAKGENTGELWEWHLGKGWEKVPGSEAPAPNGLEISKDGKWFYVGGFGNLEFVRLSRGQTPVKKDVVQVGYTLDNLRWAPDGSLFASGKTRGTPQTLSVDKINPDTLQVKQIVRYVLNPADANGAVAIQVGKDVWVGTLRGERIMVFPATPTE